MPAGVGSKPAASNAAIVMIKRGHLKFVASPADPDLLFDLEADPDELRNLASDPAYASRVAEFRNEVAQRWDLPGLHRDIVESQRRRRLIAQAVEVGQAPDWDFHSDGEGVGPYVRGADFWAPFKKARLPRK